MTDNNDEMTDEEIEELTDHVEEIFKTIWRLPEDELREHYMKEEPHMWYTPMLYKKGDNML